MDKNIFRERVYNSQYKRLVESINESLISEIKEIYSHYVSDLSSTIAENLVTINFTISGAGTSFEEVEGDMDWENVGFESRAMEAMKDIPVRMVSYGGSNYNISFLVKAEDKERALKALSKSLF